MNQVLDTISQDLPWFGKTPNPNHILATLVRPLQVRTGVHITMHLPSQWISDIMTPLVNNQCSTQFIQSSAVVAHHQDSSGGR